MKIVAPFRPFAPEVHGDIPAIADFDWTDALRMLAASVDATYNGRVPVIALTDPETAVPIPAYRYATTSDRLQRWLIEIRLAYLRSDAFDRDTLLVSPDTLIVGDVFAPFLDAELGVLIRPHAKYAGEWKCILNSIQFWRHAAKDRLIPFYERALDLIATLPEGYLVWGGDTEPLRQLLEPVGVGIRRRCGLAVGMINAGSVFSSITSTDIERLKRGEYIPRPPRPIWDFKYLRKAYQRAAFESLFHGRRDVLNGSPS